MRGSGLCALVAFLTLLVAAAIPCAAEEDVPFGLDTLLPRVPPLTHDATGRLPMITWEAFRQNPKDDSFQRGEPLPAEMYRELAKRGLTQRIPLRDDYLPMALAIQKAGAKVIFVEGWGGNGPAEDGPDPLHKLPAGYGIPGGERHYACPLIFEGWRIRADKVRATLRRFKEAGVTVDAVWLDWEVEPLTWSLGRWRQAAACSRCRQMFPPGVLDNVSDYFNFIARLHSELFSAYVAAPVLEIYPGCSVTNWELVYSTADLPAESAWGTGRIPPTDPGLFTATNPVAYGNDAIYRSHWKESWGYPLDAKHMDRVYTRIMVRQMSEDAANLQRCAPEKQSIPWVCRYCPDMEDPKVPVLSRERYREILRHLWLRGADGMQIFNAYRPRQAYATEEVEDAVAIYDEMLAFRKFLERGRIMNLAVPEVQERGAIWSGLRVGDEAVVRAFTQADGPVAFAIAPWDDVPIVSLSAPPQGATYLLTREKGAVRVERVATPPPPGEK